MYKEKEQIVTEIHQVLSKYPDMSVRYALHILDEAKIAVQLTKISTLNNKFEYNDFGKLRVCHCK